MVKKRDILKTIGFWSAIVILVFLILYPFIWMVSLSLRYEIDIFSPSIIPPKITTSEYSQLLGFSKRVGTENSLEELRSLLKDLPKEQAEAIMKKYKGAPKIFPFLRYFRNSLILAGISSLISLLVAVFGAYSFSRLRYPGRGFMRKSILIVYLFGGIVLAVPLYQMVASIGLLSTRTGCMFSLLLIYVMQTLPVSLYMLGNYFRSIPYSIEEAAIVDGATRFGVITKIIIPLSLPVLVTVYIYAFMIGWNEYMFASIFLRGLPKLYTLPFGLNELFYTEHSVWGRMMAASILTAVPVVAMFMIFERYLTSGLTIGGVKE